MSKKIEPGCMVMVLISEDMSYAGMTGTVIGKDSGQPWMSRTTGKIKSTPDNWDCRLAGVDGIHSAPAEWLLRIDDYDASQDEVEATKTEKA